MKEKINVTEYAQTIAEGLKKGILLNTNAGQFDSMVIGWGALGVCWGLPTFTAYVREGRYTKSRLDESGEFTISIPLCDADPVIFKVCGTKSGRDTDKVKEANLTLEDPEVINTPGIKEYPLTLECKVIYVQTQDPMLLEKEIQEKIYPQDVDRETNPFANRDPHTMYIGQIVDAYIIK